MNLHLAFSPSNLTNKCLLSSLFSTLSTNTAANIAALAFILFLHRHWNTIMFVMLFRRSIPSCEFEILWTPRLNTKWNKAINVASLSSCFGEEAVILLLQVDKVKIVIMIYQPPGAQIIFCAPSLPVYEKQFQFHIMPRVSYLVHAPPPNWDDRAENISLLHILQLLTWIPWEERSSCRPERSCEVLRTDCSPGQ